MKAISIRQPFAYAIVMGFKPIENRPKAWSLRGPVWIHAGRQPFEGPTDWVFDLIARQTGRSAAECHAEYRLLRDGAAGMGGIVGSATITDCVRASDSRWFVGPHGLTMRDARPLTQLVPTRGELFAFDVPPAIEAQCRRYMGAARRDAGQGQLPGMPA